MLTAGRLVRLVALAGLLLVGACGGVSCSPPLAPSAASTPQALLSDLRAWDSASVEARRAAAEEVARRCNDFSLLRMETFSCGGPSHEIAIFRHGVTALEFALVPAGSFDMGCSEDTLTSPVHRVTLTNPFLLCRTEVPQRTWEQVMGIPSVRNPRDAPVTDLTWSDAAKFCAKAGLELPTEAQWEWACRGGTTTLWSFGDDESQVGRYVWFGANSGGGPRPVAQKRPNQFGIYDMEGNVAEFCADWFGIYPTSPVTDPTGVTIPMYRVARGGTWITTKEMTRSPWRLRMNPAEAGNVCGFRPAKTCPME